MQHFVKNVPALHDVLVLVSVRHVPVSTVLPEERVLVSAVPGFSGYVLSPPNPFPSFTACPQVLLLVQLWVPFEHIHMTHPLGNCSLQLSLHNSKLMSTMCCRLYRAVVRFGYNDLSDLGDGFAQEVNTSILRQHWQLAQAKREEEAGHLETLQVPLPPPRALSCMH